jgi:hypothetical protein
MKTLRAICAALALLVCAGSSYCTEPVWIEKAKSPDGKMLAEAGAWLVGDVGNYCEVVVRSGKRVLYHDVFQPARDVRYFKFSWSPDSRALLIGEGCKPVMDLTLVRFVSEKMQMTRFDADKKIDEPLFKALPFREDIKNSAPTGSVAWHTVQWKDNRCEMAYFFHGLGYEGEALVRIDWQSGSPELKILKISPKVAPKHHDDV